MGGRGSKGLSKTNSNEKFIADIVKHYNEFDRSDLQGVVEARAMRMNLTSEQEEELLSTIDKKALLTKAD